MIKVPQVKYQGVPKLHVKYLEQPVQDAIQFYLNCCDVINGDLRTSQLTQNIKELKKPAIKSFLAQVSTKKYRELLDIQQVFNNKNFQPDFLKYISDIRRLLAEMLNSTSKIYFKHILDSKPADLLDIHNYLVSNYSIQTSNRELVFDSEITNKGAVFQLLEKIYNYNEFRNGDLVREWGAYKLCEELDISVCPYCNRMYTFTIVNLKNEITRPELDHYFPKSLFPLFSISFYNLIPSCKVCNSSIKKNEYLKIDEYIHPYINSLSPLYRFDFLSLDFGAIEGKNKNNKIFINKNGIMDNKSDNFLKKFLITEIYNQHRNVVQIFIKKHKDYPDSVVSEISRLVDTNKEKLLLTLYNPAEEKDIIDTSLGKLQRDLYLKFRNLYDL